jgi:hypothetical protein
MICGIRLIRFVAFLCENLAARIVSESIQIKNANKVAPKISARRKEIEM